MGAGRNLEQTSSLYIGIMLMFFVFISKLVESGFHRAKHWLQHHHEISLVAVLEHIKDEIMLVGTLSMMLLTIESSIAGWCVPLADQYTPANSQKNVNQSTHQVHQAVVRVQMLQVAQAAVGDDWTSRRTVDHRLLVLCWAQVRVLGPFARTDKRHLWT